MNVQAVAAELESLSLWREEYREEMNCQIIHDSIHFRAGWTKEYLLKIESAPVGYGSVAIAGPWKDKPTIYEFHLTPSARHQSFRLFEALMDVSGGMAIETQSNDLQLTVMLHAFSKDVFSESILFHDRLTTNLLPPPGAIFRKSVPDDVNRLVEQKLDPGGAWIVEVNGQPAATGGILFHYNRPYGDIHMEVAERYRRQGLGSYLVQELKRVCREEGNVPSARCNVGNGPSRQTLQKAGFTPCGHILVGKLLGRTSSQWSS